MLSSLRIAASFLTVLPVGGGLDFRPENVRASAPYFTLVGWGIGGVLAVICLLALRVGLTPLLGAFLVVGCGILLTRGLHLDGVADLADGLGGGYEPERRLEIMKDSFIGPFGVMALVLVLVGKVAALSMLAAGPGFLLPPLLAAPAAARFAMVGLAYRSRYPRPAGTGHPFVGQLNGRALCIAGLFLLPVVAGGWSTVLVAVAAQLPALWLRRKAHAALGGVTGDVLGASCEYGELAGWLGGCLYLGFMG